MDDEAQTKNIFASQCEKWNEQSAFIKIYSPKIFYFCNFISFEMKLQFPCEI